MNTMKARWQAHLRIIWAVTTKDILEALKNKNIIALLTTSLLMVVFYRVYPGLLRDGELPSLLIYDEGASALVAQLEASPAFDVWVRYRSVAHLQDALADGDVPELGLVIPAGFDQALAEGRPAVLPGYVMNWAPDEAAATLRGSAAAEISRLVGAPVTIEPQAPVYPRPDSDGAGVTMGMGLLFVLTMVGLTLVPHLMLEEKKGRTLEVLLVSPASIEHLLIGKALTGLFYTLLAAAIALAISHNLILHWGLAIAATVAGALFLVAVGLWLGMRIEDRGQLTVWASILIVPLLFPVILTLLEPLIPNVLVQGMRWIPTVVVFNLLRTAIANPIPAGSGLSGLAWVLAWAGVTMAAVAWLVRRLDRVTEGATPALPNVKQALPGSRSILSEGAQWFAARSRRKRPHSEEPDFPTSASFDSVRQTAPDSAQDARVVGSGLPAPLRIVLAITAKDIREALRNRLFISILFGVGIMIATNALLPRLLFRGMVPTAIVYDEAQPGSSRYNALRALVGRSDYRLVMLDSRAELEQALTQTRAERLGLVIPADTAGGQAIEVTGYRAHWAAPDKIAAWADFFAAELSAVLGRPVRINLGAGLTDAAHLLYPAVDAGGEPLMAALLLAVVVTTLGLALVPLLLIEEKEAHTLDTLLVSPASLGQLITAKAAAGFTYCVVAAAVLLAFNWSFFAAPGAALAAVLLGTACVVALGLLLGALADNPSTLSLWGVGGLLGLGGLTAAAMLAPATWPAALRSLLALLPGAQMINLLRYSMAGNVPAPLLWTGAAALAASAAATYGLVGVALRRARG